jgi:hypothetical protein
MRLRVLTGLALAMLVALLSGCSKTLGKPEDVDGFLNAVAHGDTSSWKLATHPSSAAAEAWRNQEVTGELADTLREHGKEWACAAAKAIKTARESEGKVTFAKQLEIGTNASHAGATTSEADSFVARMLTVGEEAAIVTSDVCEGIDHLRGF